MGKKWKDYYDNEYLISLKDKLAVAYPAFDGEKFLNLTLDKVEALEFNARQELIAASLYEVLDLNYPAALEIFYKILGPELRGNSGNINSGWWLWPVSKYVENYGSTYFDDTVEFSKELTKRFTGEYCMRPVIKNYPKESMEVLKLWATDPHERVRRLASECIRIRLPWAKKMTVALDYFDDYFIILDSLKNDPDKYIQKSVANNLNDLYKEDKDKFDFIIESWEATSPSKETQWIIKHGSRTKNKE